MQEALSLLGSEPTPQQPLADTINDTDEVLRALQELIESAGLTREEVVDNALARHPEFAEFESVAAVAELYSALDERLIGFARKPNQRHTHTSCPLTASSLRDRTTAASDS